VLSSGGSRACADFTDNPGRLAALNQMLAPRDGLPLDREARRLGVTRQSLITLWLADKLAQPAAASKR
jgi:hypothetical protein